MLRYVFDTVGQLSRHVHAREGAALLFFPSALKDQRTGDHVLLELQMRDCDQRAVVRAIIHSRVDGRLKGIWLQFSDQLSRAIEADARTIRRRAHPRVGSDFMVQVREPDSSARIARMTDVSSTGARLGSAPGLKVGSEIELQLLSAPRQVPRALGRAAVVRASAGDVGLRFASSAAPQIGALLSWLQHEWQSALTVHHAPECCRLGQPTEPTLPHARQQRSTM